MAELGIASMIAASFTCNHGLMVLLDASAASRFPANRLDNDHIVTLCVYTLFVLFKVHLVVWSRRLSSLRRRLVDTASMLGRSFRIYIVVGCNRVHGSGVFASAPLVFSRTLQ